ncbi:MAG TPA: hypothetical protein VGF59_07900 [Bryobacteraceae bacterium]
MNPLLIGSILAALGIMCGVVLAVRREPMCHLPATIDWIDEASVERYRPMLRLLSSEDLRFLREQPGFRPQMEAKLRSQRCRLFRDYLGGLESDFQRVCLALKLLMVQSENDRPDLAATLVQARFQFARGVLMARISLQLFRWGVGTVNVGELLRLFGSVHGELRAMVPAVGAATA